MIDVAPTILEAAGLPEPREVNSSIPQRPMDGVSMVYSFDGAHGLAEDIWELYER